MVRAELAGAASMHRGGHELCVRRLASLLQLARSYREGREWSCECPYRRLLAGVRSHLAHHWGRGPAACSISAGAPNAAAKAAGRDNAVDGSDPCSYAPHVDIELVSKRLKQRRQFDAAARVLGKGTPRFNLAAAVEGCLRCRSAGHAGWRFEIARPELADDLHYCRGAEFLELVARQRRQALGGAGAGEPGTGGRDPAVMGARG